MTVVYDKFHIIANYNDVIDQIRRREWRQAEADDKPFIKGQRFNLFMNPENLTPKRESSLKELLAMNEDLNQAYILKDTLKQLWTYTYKACASKFLDKWIGLGGCPRIVCPTGNCSCVALTPASMQSCGASKLV